MRTLIALLGVLGLGIGNATWAAETATQRGADHKDNQTHRVVNPERTPTTSTEGTARNARDTGTEEGAPGRTRGTPDPHSNSHNADEN